MNDKKEKIIEEIKNKKYQPNITHCANCGKEIDVTKDKFILGWNLQENYIYCSKWCEDWHFSKLML